MGSCCKEDVWGSSSEPFLVPLLLDVDMQATGHMKLFWWTDDSMSLRMQNRAAVGFCKALITACDKQSSQKSHSRFNALQQKLVEIASLPPIPCPKQVKIAV